MNIEYNCAETMLMAGCKKYNIDLYPQTLKALGPFGGGMQIESVCGALTGSLSVIGLLFIDNYQHESDEVEIIVNSFLKRFEKKTGSIVCSELRYRYHDVKNGCEKIIKAAAVNLEKIVEHYKSF
jgi:C_GCAxxG_C_C family probable redox protein